ncbi:MAG: cytochrome C oxidase subunit III [Lysobacter sp.]|nr:cytochrome C oxidase subunit III [Lysobacter sp.]
MKRATSVVGDLAGLPDHNYGPTSLGWWGVIGFMLIEAMGFVLAIGTYYYLVPYERSWPPTAPVPPLPWATAFLVVGVLSELPNAWVNRMARQQRLAAVQWGLTLMSVLGLVMLVLRGFELVAMNARWDQNAYGSIVWALLLLHTMHISTDVFDSIVLAVLVWTKKVDGRKFSDVSDNALYWHFIVWSWLVLYLVIYWTPRWL